MKRIVNWLKTTLVVVSFAVLFSGLAKGQAISEAYCKQIETSVVRQLRPTKVDRAEVYSHECVFEFTLAGNNDMSLSVQAFATEKASQDSLDGFLEIVALGNGAERNELPFEKLDIKNSWDEVFFLRGTTTNSAVLGLRKGTCAIRILSRKDMGVVQVEELLTAKILPRCQ